MSGTKQRIIDEAAEMFKSYGIRAVTMDMLASRLGISKRTLYEVFKDKEDLLLCVLRSMIEKRRIAVEETLAESDNTLDAIFRLLRISQVHIKSMSPALLNDLKRYEYLIEREGLNKIPDLTVIRTILEHGIANELFRQDMDVAIVSLGIYGMFEFTSDNNLFPKSEFPPQDIVRHLYLNFLRGICTSRGLEIFEDYIRDSSTYL